MSVTNLVKLGTTISSLYEVESNTLKVVSHLKTFRGTVFARTLQKQGELLKEMRGDIEYEIDGYLYTDNCTMYRRRMRNMKNFKCLLSEIYSKRAQIAMRQARRLCKEHEGVAGAAFVQLAHKFKNVSNLINITSADSFVNVLIQSYKEIARELNDMSRLLKGYGHSTAEKVIGVYARLMMKQAEYLETEFGRLYDDATPFAIDAHRDHLLTFSRSMSVDVEEQLIAA